MINGFGAVFALILYRKRPPVTRRTFLARSALMIPAIAAVSPAPTPAVHGFVWPDEPWRWVRVYPDAVNRTEISFVLAEPFGQDAGDVPPEGPRRYRFFLLDPSA